MGVKPLKGPLCAACIHALVVSDVASRGIRAPGLNGRKHNGETATASLSTVLAGEFDLVTRPLLDSIMMCYPVMAITRVNGTDLCWRHATEEIHRKYNNHGRYWE